MVYHALNCTDPLPISFFFLSISVLDFQVWVLAFIMVIISCVSALVFFLERLISKDSYWNWVGF